MPEWIVGEPSLVAVVLIAVAFLVGYWLNRNGR